MRYLFFPLFCSICLLTYGQVIPNEPINSLTKDSIKSTIDGNIQLFYYYKSTAKKNMPLIVQLHSWSYPVDSLKTMEVDIEARSNNYNYLFPNFRGVNNHIKACCSNYVISDIDEAIDWAIKNMNVDRNQIYIVGVSGGGYATLAMYMKSRHNIKAFSAWVPISDLGNWYQESVERKNKYAAEIIKCTAETEFFDSSKARERSPLLWKTPVKKRNNSTIQIFAGIHDGYTGPVPISHSVNFYNKLLSDYGISDSLLYVSKKDLDFMLNEQTYNAPFNLKIGDRTVCYQKKTKNIMLTIFEGGHEMLSKGVLGYIRHMNGRR
jgi:predicted peptidase